MIFSPHVLAATSGRPAGTEYSAECPEQHHQSSKCHQGDSAPGILAQHPLPTNAESAGRAGSLKVSHFVLQLNSTLDLACSISQIMALTSTHLEGMPIVRSINDNSWYVLCRLDTHMCMLNNAKAVLSKRIEHMPEDGLLLLLEETFPYVRSSILYMSTAGMSLLAY